MIRLQCLLCGLLCIFTTRQVNAYVIGSTGKPATSSGHYFPPSVAVDGDTNAAWPNVFHTDFSGRPLAWWQVDLQEEVVSPKVTIYFRPDYSVRRNGIRVSLTPNAVVPTQFCHTVQGRADGTDIPAIYELECEGRGQYVTISTITDNGDGVSMDFGEIVVHGCSEKTFGANCDQDCHCANGTCDPTTGECFSGCLPGWSSSACDTLMSAADISIAVTYLPLCNVQVTFAETTVSMDTLKAMETISMATSVECMHACDGHPVCTTFNFTVPDSCSLWMPWSPGSGLSGTQLMMQKVY